MTQPIYAGAGKCDVSKGVAVGVATFTLIPGSGVFNVTVTLFSPYNIDEIHINVVQPPALVATNPTGSLTVAPGQYTFGDPIPGINPSSYTYTIPWSTSAANVIVHMKVCNVVYDHPDHDDENDHDPHDSFDSNDDDDIVTEDPDPVATEKCRIKFKDAFSWFEERLDPSDYASCISEGAVPFEPSKIDSKDFVRALQDFVAQASCTSTCEASIIQALEPCATVKFVGWKKSFEFLSIVTAWQNKCVLPL